MADKSEDKLKNTDLRTLWSETLLEMLVEGVQEGWSDKALNDIIKELFNKGYKTEQLIKILDKKLGPEAAIKLAKFVIT